MATKRPPPLSEWEFM